MKTITGTEGFTANDAAMMRHRVRAYAAGHGFTPDAWYNAFRRESKRFGVPLLTIKKVVRGR